MSENTSPQSNPDPERPRPQPEKHRRGYPAGEDRGDCGGVRVGEIFPGAGRFVCGGLPAVSGCPFHLHPSRRMTQAAKAQVDEVLLCSGGAGAAPAAGGAGHPRAPSDTGTELLNSLRLDVFPAGQPPLPQRALSAAYAGGGGGAGAGLPGVRRAFLCAVRGGAGLQLPGSLPRPAAERE